jgi:hypothetical protein
MEGAMNDGPENLPRRRLIWAVGGVAAGVTYANIFHATAQQQKISRTEVKYQDSPKGESMCGTCAYFEPPQSCYLVEGELSQTGWCQLFSSAD